MKLNVNLHEVEDRGFEPLQPGWYPVRVVGAEVKTTKAGDSQYIHWELEVLPDHAEYAGRKLFVNTSLKPAALPILKRFITACQVELDADGGFATEDVIGAELEVQVALREYEGKTDNEVKAFRAI